MKRQLRVYERDHLYPQCISYYLDLMRLSPADNPYILNYWEVMSFGDSYFWARDDSYLKKAFWAWFKKWTLDAKARQNFFQLFEDGRKKFLKAYKKMKTQKVETMSESALGRLRLHAICLTIEHLLYAEYTVDLFDDYIGELFQERLNKLTGKPVSDSDLGDFLHPATTSSSAAYHQEILKLSLDNRISKKKISELSYRFCWIRMSWDGENELTAKDIIKDIIAEQKKTERQRLEELNQMAVYSDRVQAERNNLLNKYHIKPNAMSVYFELLDKFNIFHDYRKEIQMCSNQIIYSVLREIPRRFAVSYKDLLYYNNEEVNDLLARGKLVKSETIKARRAGMLLLIRKGQIKEFLGDAAISQGQKLVWSQFSHKSEEIKGLPASRGMAQGIAFVTKDAKEANAKMKKGEILVTSMTTVDYLPAMRKAAAIVTDDGGATCHAAIVARELGIPCVVGVKVGTKIIKRGDNLKVDANLGVVRIING